MLDYPVLEVMRGGRLMGLDVGDKTIGVGISDLTWQISTPLLTVKRQGNRKDFAAVKKLIEPHQITGIVVGLPLNMDGSEGGQAAKVRSFVAALAAAVELPLLLWDERWSTLAVARTLKAADLSRKKQKQVIDRAAASYILQGVLDAWRAFTGSIIKAP